MAELRDFARHFSHYFAGRVGGMVVGMVSMPILTRALSVADYGALDLVTKIVVLSAAVSKLGLQHALPRFYTFRDDQRNEIQSYHSTFLVGISFNAAIAMVIGLGILLRMPYASLPVSRQVFWFAAASMFARGVQSILYGFLRVHRKTQLYNITEVIQRASTTAIVLTLLFAWERSLRAVWAANGIVDTAVVVGLCAYYWRSGLFRPAGFDRRLFYSALIFGLPMVLYELGWIVLDSGDRLLVQRYLGLTQLGYYSAACNVAAYYYDLLATPVTLSLTPLYMKLWVENGEAAAAAFLSKSLHGFLMCALGLTAVAIACAPGLLVIVVSKRYATAASLFPLLLIGMLLFALLPFVNAGLYLNKMTGVMARYVCYSAAANVGLNVLLLPRIGLTAAAAATAASYGLLVFLGAWRSRHLLRLTPEWRSWGIAGAVATLACLVASAIHFQNTFIEVLVRFSVSSAIYVAGVAALDSRTRDRVARIVKPRIWMCAPRQRETSEHSAV